VVTRAGQHCQRVHQHVVQQGRVDLQHVQADELWVKLVGRRVWMGMAIAVPARLWLGGVVSPRRDLVLITTLVQMIRSCARSLATLVCVDGLASSVTAVLRVLRHPVRAAIWRPGGCCKPAAFPTPPLPVRWVSVARRSAPGPSSFGEARAPLKV
jgi:transposase-like protein